MIFPLFNKIRWNLIYKSIKPKDLSKEVQEILKQYINGTLFFLDSATSSIAEALIALRQNNTSNKKIVLIPNFCCRDIVSAVKAAGCIPVGVQMSNSYIEFDREDLNNKISHNTLCIINVHTLGYVSDCRWIKELCDEKNVYLLEDCAQAFGGRCCQKKVGALGHLSVFSFSLSKALSSYRGGLIAVNDDRLIKNVVDLYRIHNKSKYGFSDLAYAVFSKISIEKLSYFVPTIINIKNRAKNRVSIQAMSKFIYNLLYYRLTEYEDEINKRKIEFYRYYDAGIPTIDINNDSDYSYLCYLYLVKDHKKKHRLKNDLKKTGIYPLEIKYEILDDSIKDNNIYEDTVILPVGGYSDIDTAEKAIRVIQDYL